MQKHLTRPGVCPALCVIVLVFSLPVAAPAAAQEGFKPLPVTIYATQGQSGVPLSQIGTSVSVLEQEQIEKSGALNVGDALRHVPGVEVNQAGGVGGLTQVRIRGSEANHILLIVDGVQYNDPSGFGFDFSSLLAANIERIEVIRGPQSGLYGSGAHAGVIAITTKSGKFLRKPIASGKIEAGSFGTLAASAFTASGNENVWGSLSANGLRTDGFNQSTAGSEKDGSNIGDLHLRMGINPVNGFDADAGVRYSSRSAQYDENNSTNPLAPPLNDNSLPEYNEQDTSANVAANYRAPGSNFSQRVAATTYGFLRSSIDPYGAFDSSGNRHEALYKANYTFATPDFGHSKHDFSAQVSHEWLNYETTFQPEHELQTTGFAGELRSGFENKYFFSAALRHDLSEYFENATTYRLTAKANGDEGLSFHGAAGTGVTNPTLDELFGSSVSFVGNPDLKPEESFEWEIGVDKNWKIVPVTTGLTYFNGRTRNEIRTVYAPVNTALNDPGISTRQGIEALISWAPTNNFNLTTTYTYTDAKNGDGSQEVRRAPHAAAIDADWRFFNDKANLTLGAAINGSIVDDDFRSFPSQRVHLKDYVLLNGMVSYQITPQTQTYLKLQNIIDQQYEEVFGTRAQPFSAYAGVKMTLGE